MCLIETYSRVWVGKHLSDMFPIRNRLKQGEALSPLLLNFALDYAIKRFQANQDGLNLNGNNLNISKLYSGRNYEQIQVRECLLSIGAEYFIFQFAFQKFKYEDIQNHNFVCCFV